MKRIALLLRRHLRRRCEYSPYPRLHNFSRRLDKTRVRCGKKVALAPGKFRAGAGEWDFFEIRAPCKKIVRVGSSSCNFRAPLPGAHSQRPEESGGQNYELQQWGLRKNVKRVGSATNNVHGAGQNTTEILENCARLSRALLGNSRVSQKEKKRGFGWRGKFCRRESPKVRISFLASLRREREERQRLCAFQTIPRGLHNF